MSDRSPQRQPQAKNLLVAPSGFTRKAQLTVSPNIPRLLGTEAQQQPIASPNIIRLSDMEAQMDRIMTMESHPPGRNTSVTSQHLKREGNGKT
jgi:hypothetical protein